MKVEVHAFKLDPRRGSCDRVNSPIDTGENTDTVAVGFGTLVVIVLAGLGGPLLGSVQRRFVPVVVGEILAGILVGPAVADGFDPTDPTIAFLGEVGFAMLMLTVGMHLPLRDPRLAASVRDGALLAALVCVLAVPAGLLAAAIAGGGHAAVYAVVLASGSAAVLLPAIEELDLRGRGDDGDGAGDDRRRGHDRARCRSCCSPTASGTPRWARCSWRSPPQRCCSPRAIVALGDWVHRVRHLSKRRHWALDLRLSLLVLFALAWVAQRGGTSVLIAGFGAGLMVAIIGGPKRLSTQMRGVADGFFIPLFFVVLGARLDLGARQ